MVEVVRSMLGSRGEGEYTVQGTYNERNHKPIVGTQDYRGVNSLGYS